MQNILYDFKIIILGILILSGCQKNNNESELPYPLMKNIDYKIEGKDFLDGLDQKLEQNSITKYDYLREKSRYFLAKKEYIKAINFYNSLDSTYFRYSIEKDILTNNVIILQCNKENNIKKRDSIISYMKDFYINKEKNIHDNNFFQFLLKTKEEMRDMLWSYERINLDIDGNIKNEGK
jgi:hypothetical protein